MVRIVKRNTPISVFEYLWGPQLPKDQLPK